MISYVHANQDPLILEFGILCRRILKQTPTDLNSVVQEVLIENVDLCCMREY